MQPVIAAVARYACLVTLCTTDGAHVNTRPDAGGIQPHADHIRIRLFEGSISGYRWARHPESRAEQVRLMNQVVHLCLWVLAILCQYSFQSLQQRLVGLVVAQFLFESR